MNNLANDLDIQPTIPDTLAGRTYDAIKAEIISGHMPQGSKIVETELALKYGVSRGPLREAIHRLEQVRLITRVPRTGSCVIKLDSKMMEDIYVVREALEGMAARLAARHISVAEAQALHTLLDQHQQAISRSEDKAYVQLEGNIDFHYRIALASRNQWILEQLDGAVYQLIRMCRYQSGQMPSRPTKALQQHRQITSAIASKDEELAEILMRRHISSAWRSVKSILEEPND